MKTFRTVPTKQVNRVAKYQNIATKKNPQSYKVLPTGVFDSNTSVLTNHLTSSAEMRCYSTSIKTLGSNPSMTHINSARGPKAIGPFSQGVKAHGNFYVSGCLGINGEVSMKIIWKVLTTHGDRLEKW